MSRKDLPRCGATTKKNQTPCARVAGAGTTHEGYGRCHLHGGASPQAEEAGRVAIASAQAQSFATAVAIHPIDAILQCIAITQGEIEYASRKIQELSDKDLVGPLVTSRPLKLEKGAESTTTRVEEHGPAELHIWIKVRQEAMTRLVAYSKQALAANVAERQTRLAERQAELIQACIKGILTDLGVLNHPQAPTVVRRHLSLIATQEDPPSPAAPLEQRTATGGTA